MVKKQLKRVFLNNLGLLFSARENVINNFKSRLFPIKQIDKIPTHEPTSESTTETTPEPAIEPAIKPTKH